MRLLAVAAAVLVAGQALAQSPAQRELNALTGVPEGTRCFRSFARAQEMSRHYVASAMCPQLKPMSPARFVQAMQALKIADVNILTDACHIQLKLMFRAGREWIAGDETRNCAQTAREMARIRYFREFVVARKREK
jgi:hypothetical protein